MIIPIPSTYRRFTMKVRIEAFHPLVLGMTVYDPTHPHSHYFRRRISFRASHFRRGKAVREISIPLPVSPEHLMLRVHNKYHEADEGFQVTDLKVEQLPPSQTWASQEQHRFMDFAIAFAQKAGYSSTGFYSSLDHEFLIQYLPTITDAHGQELVTPARIHQKMPRVQLSKRQFKTFSIPVRVAILAHEGCHFFKNTRSEKTADLCGIQYYLDYGFPTIEAVYAATKVFLQHPQSVGAPHIVRTKDIMDFIDQYKAQKNQRTA